MKNIINKAYIDWQEIKVILLSSHQSQNENNENKTIT